MSQNNNPNYNLNNSGSNIVNGNNQYNLQTENPFIPKKQMNNSNQNYYKDANNNSNYNPNNMQNNNNNQNPNYIVDNGQYKGRVPSTRTDGNGNNYHYDNNPKANKNNNSNLNIGSNNNNVYNGNNGAYVNNKQQNYINNILHQTNEIDPTNKGNDIKKVQYQNELFKQIQETRERKEREGKN